MPLVPTGLRRAAAIATLSTLTLSSWPTGFAQTQPSSNMTTGSAGQMLAIEPLAPAFSLADADKAYAIWYSSTDGTAAGNDQASQLTTSGVIFLPKGLPPAGGWPVIAWAHGTVGIGDSCAPSRNPRSERDAQYLNNWLKEGYAIVATDYQGLGTPGPHAYLHSRAAAYATLDSLRATLKTKELPLGNKIVIVGQSQGAAAAFATAGFAPDYAPELKILGTIATGTPHSGRPSKDGKIAYRSSPAEQESTDPSIAYILYIAAVANQSKPRLPAEQVLSEKGLDAMKAAETTCVQQMFDVVKKEQLSWSNTFKSDFMSYYAQPFSKGQFPTLKIATPVFFGIGGADRDAPTKFQQDLAEQSCEAGTVVEAHTYPGMDHSQTVNSSFPNSRLFARKLFNGERIAGNCAAKQETLSLR